MLSWFDPDLHTVYVPSTSGPRAPRGPIPKSGGPPTQPKPADPSTYSTAPPPFSIPRTSLPTIPSVGTSNTHFDYSKLSWYDPRSFAYRTLYAPAHAAAPFPTTWAHAPATKPKGYADGVYGYVRTNLAAGRKLDKHLGRQGLYSGVSFVPGTRYTDWTGQTHNRLFWMMPQRHYSDPDDDPPVSRGRARFNRTRPRYSRLLRRPRRFPWRPRRHRRF